MDIWGIWLLVARTGTAWSELEDLLNERVFIDYRSAESDI